MIKRRRAPRRGEAGQVLVVAALMMTVLLSMVALAVDIGRLSLARRQAQNAADAAAYAGAALLPGNAAMAIAEAHRFSDANGFGPTSNGTAQPAVESAIVTNDTMFVTVRRTVPYTFAGILGFSIKEITASARVRAYVATGFPLGAQGVFPFAVWGGNLDWDTERQPGNWVTYRSNQWDSQVDSTVKCNNGPNCRWSVNGNNFKGYLHDGSGWVHVTPISGPLVTYPVQGGNAQGTQYRDPINAVAVAGGVIRIPVVDRGANPPGQGINLRVSGFLCIEPDQVGNPSNPWRGRIVNAEIDPRCTALDGAGGGTPPHDTPNVYAVTLIE